VFTGIVEELGEIVAVEHVANAARLTVRGSLVCSDAQHGDSVAVNGVCLTVVGIATNQFTVDVVDETLQRSSLDKIHVGDVVNLERAVAAGQRLGGHIVQGHVDGVGTLVEHVDGGLTRFAIPAGLTRYVVEKGSITVDGVSLTVAAVGAQDFSVALIPTTLEVTTLGRRRPGDRVNIEVDVLAKYVERLASPHLAAPAAQGGTAHEEVR